MAMPDTYVKCTLVCASPQKSQFFNIFYYKPVTMPTFTSSLMTDSNTIGAAIMGEITNGMAANMTTQSTIVGMNTELIEGGQVYDTAQLLGTPGTLDVDELADFEAVVVQKRTEVSGKSGRGRWYFGPVPETLTDENYIEGGAYDNFNVMAGHWKSNVTVLGAVWNPMLYSKKNQTLSHIVSVYVNPKLGQIGGRKSHSIL